MLWAHLVEMPPPVTAARPDLPPQVNDVVARAMAKAPEERYDSCHDLLRDLEDALSVEQSPADFDRTPSRQGARHTQPADEGRSRSGLAPLRRETTSSRSERDVEADETRGWVSHPSLPPGAMGPLPWQNATSSGGAAPLSGAPSGTQSSGTQSQDDGFGAEADVTEEDQEGAWGAEETDSDSSRQPRSRRRLWLSLTAAAVVVVLAVAAGAWYLQRRGAEPFRTYTSADTVVPYSLSFPESWTVERGVASDVVLSPRPDAVGATFFLQTSQDAWGGMRNLLRTSPTEAVGTYVYAGTSGAEPTTQGLRDAITALMPNSTLSFGPTHGQTPIGGAPAHEFEGTLADPAEPKTTLHAMFDLVLPPEGGSVLIAYFAPPEEFESQRPVFMKIRDGIRFTG
jgi:hypothetical protein